MSSQQNITKIYDLFIRLCKVLTPENHESALKNYTSFLKNSVNVNSVAMIDENSLLLKISNYLNQSETPDAVQQFTVLYESLSATMEPQLRKQILTFLLSTVQCDATPNFSLLNNIPQSHNSYTKSYYPIIAKKPTTIPAPLFSTTTNHSEAKNYTIARSQQSTREGIENEDLILDAINSFVGIEGKYLRKDIIKGGFRLDPKARDLMNFDSEMLLRLANIGYYHDTLKNFTEKDSFRYPIGLLGQGLVTALNKELTQYYGMVSNLKAQFNHQRHPSTNIDTVDPLTLEKLMIWMSRTLERMQKLLMIAESCQDKKGGGLASAVYNFVWNGDPIVKQLAREILIAICLPLQTMLSKWLLEGEIEDPYSEFFIEMLPETKSECLWHDKYRLREQMLPNFIPRRIAKMIFVTGKSINFLREICNEKSSTVGRDEFKQCIMASTENLIAPVPDTKLHVMIETAYLNTSKRVLDMITGPYKLLDHLQAMRRYLLLGQGDFIGVLMENLKLELDKPARELLRHNLSSIMTSAVRATNAQFEDPEVLEHLDVKLVDAYDGDLGWDVFQLSYEVRGPLLPILEQSMGQYNRLFQFLWKVKHIEFLLMSKIWKQQKCNEKLLRSMSKDLSTVYRRLNVCTMEMINFITQMEYYILFEVIECSWVDFLKHVNGAKALDDILEAHERFLKNVHAGIFFDGKSALSANLETAFSAIIQLESWQDNFFEICFKELQARNEFNKEIVTSGEKGEYGVTIETRLVRDNDKKLFEYVISNCKKELNKIAEEYSQCVAKFLLQLASSNEHKLQQFGIRLDFNEFYKNRDQKLSQPLTFEHLRASVMSNSMKNKYSDLF